MSAPQRAELGQVAFRLAGDVQAGNAAGVQAGTVAHYAGDATQTAALIRSTGQQIAGDTVAVEQVYLLDAPNGAPANGSADFSCALAGTGAETDFSIDGLPAGKFAFADVRAAGPHPYTLAFLLQSEGGAWKMAGFYPHTRVVNGHDGLWYWNAARAAAKGNRPWQSWLLYGAAAELLQPAVFVSSTNLDRLRTEQRTAAPQALSNGLNTQTPLAVKGAGGDVYRVTGLELQPPPDGAGNFNLVVHREAAAGTDNATVTEGNLAVARALLLLHPEVAQDAANVWVFADLPDGASVLTARAVAALGSSPAAAR